MDQLKEEALRFSERLVETCRIPASGGMCQAEVIRCAVPCVTAYRKQKEVLEARVRQAGVAGPGDEISVR